MLAKGSSSIRNCEGESLRAVEVDERAFDFEADRGCLGADCERARENDGSGAVTGLVAEGGE